MKAAELRLETFAPIVHASLTGDIDISNAGELREELRGMTSNYALGLLLDLSQVDYLDSAGIHLIHRLREDLRARAQQLALVIAPESLIHVTLRLAGVSWEEETFDSVDAARRSLTPGQ